jgi:hypothetical protein
MSLGRALVFATNSAHAEPVACLQNDSQPPQVGLTGMLRQGHFIGPRRPPDGSPAFHVLDLGTPTGRDKSAGGPPIPNMRSVLMYATDHRRLALLDKAPDKRVTVRFSSVSPRIEDYHRRPVIGAAGSVTPEPWNNDVGGGASQPFEQPTRPLLAAAAPPFSDWRRHRPPPTDLLHRPAADSVRACSALISARGRRSGEQARLAVRGRCRPAHSCLQTCSAW